MPMFRRCLTCLLSKLFQFCSKSATDADDVLHLPRDVAEELVICSIASLVACTDVSVPYDEFVYASDASLGKGAFTRRHVGQSLANIFWLGGDRKGSYTALDNPARAQRRALGHDGGRE